MYSTLRLIVSAIPAIGTSYLSWRYTMSDHGFHDFSKLEVLSASVMAVSWITYIVCDSFFPYIWGDLAGIPLLLKLKNQVKKLQKEEVTMATMFERTVARVPEKCALIYKDESYTFSEVHDKANQVANLLKSWNIPKGEAVAIFMVNEASMVWVSLGLVKLGVTAANINSNIRHESLIHCLKTCACKRAIVSKQLLNALDGVLEAIPELLLYVNDVPPIYLPAGYYPFCIDEHPTTMVGPEARKHLSMKDTVCYIFTSGTTGLPKAAKIMYSRIHPIFILYQVLGYTEDDVIYVCLPMYHSLAGAMGLASAVTCGATIFLREKFSATEFWNECRKHKVTVILYIGELLRYLLNQPKNSQDGEHDIRLAVGGGFREDIWNEFVTRFRIPKVIEFFGATEGTTLMFNLNNKAGACGQYSPFKRLIDPYPKCLVKFDMDTTMPIRDDKGRCIEVKQGETGLFMASFTPYTNPEKIYEGSADLGVKKVVRNAFKEGDVYFNFGDLMYQDEEYNLYFADRIGDTFRWKGENVSTLEVANILTKLVFINDANVYGVKIPGCDGRAGMASIELADNQKDLKPRQLPEIYAECVKSLPVYARPLFLRIPRTWEVTSTFKHQKMKKQQEGFDITQVSDPVYCIDNVLKTYSRVTQDMYTKLTSGKVRF